MSANAFGWYDRSSSGAGSSIAFPMVGPQFTLVTARGPAYGQAQVFVDGTSVAIVDLYNATIQQPYSQVVNGPRLGLHTVKIRLLGTHNSAATGSTVVIDGVTTP